jgi:hypothetical protein
MYSFILRKGGIFTASSILLRTTHRKVKSCCTYHLQNNQDIFQLVHKRMEERLDESSIIQFNVTCINWYKNSPHLLPQ